MQTREFHLGDVLSIIINRTVITDRAVSFETNRTRTLIGFLTGRDDWYKHRPMATANNCRLYLVKKFPQFATPEMDGAVEDLDKEIKAADGGIRADVVVACWLEKQIAKYGEYVVVESMV